MTGSGDQDVVRLKVAVDLEDGVKIRERAREVDRYIMQLLRQEPHVQLPSITLDTDTTVLWRSPLCGAEARAAHHQALVPLGLSAS
ncbi:MAG: hypothetical protein DMG49_04145 [Acidobacteria bacterium]|nr:MAG: hypothetical protein DMG49_04145 [Acidobacteriota bacterium]